MTESILAAGESPAGAIVAAGRRGSLDWHGCRAEGEKNVLDTEPPVMTGVEARDEAQTCSYLGERFLC